MLTLLDGQWFDAAPIPEPDGPVVIDIKDNHVILRKGAHIVGYGPIFYVMRGNAQIEPRTGRILKKNGTIRAVFDGNAYEIIV